MYIEKAKYCIENFFSTQLIYGHKLWFDIERIPINVLF